MSATEVAQKVGVLLKNQDLDSSPRQQVPPASSPLGRRPRYNSRSRNSSRLFCNAPVGNENLWHAVRVVEGGNQPLSFLFLQDMCP